MKNACLFAALAALMLMSSDDLGAQQPPGRDPGQPQTRRADAVSKTVHDKILVAQDAGQSNDHATAISILTSILASNRLSDYERSVVNQYLGYAYHAAGDIASAIRAFEEVLLTPELNPRNRNTLLYTLAQLCTVNEQYGAALGFIDSWFELESEPRPEAFILRAQILYHLGRFRDMVAPIETALSVARARDIDAKENWYALLAFGYFQQENYAGIRDVNKILLEKWPKKQYWLYLANAYRELQDDTSLLIAYDVLYLQGLLRSESELVTLAQLYLQDNLPFEAGIVLTAAIDDGQVRRTAGNLRLLSQAWSLAQEHERAIAPLEAAAALEDDGDLYIRLANAQLSLGRHRECADAVRHGLEKGNLRNPDHARISLGICLYNLHDYVAARRAFRGAADSERSKTTAYQWIRTIDDDLARLQHIEQAEAAVRELPASRQTMPQ